MAAPCDPAPENAIIVVCSVYFGEESQERVFPGAPCWYADPPPLETRKRCRNETMGEDRTFVTTVYESSRRRFAGICISQPHRTACPGDTTGFVSIGVAISGAVTIARKKPSEEEPDLDVPNPGDNAFFTADGKIQFDTFDAADEPPTGPSTSLGPVLIRFLRSVLPPTTPGGNEWKFTLKSVLYLVKMFCVWTNELTEADLILESLAEISGQYIDPALFKVALGLFCGQSSSTFEDRSSSNFLNDSDENTLSVISYVCNEGLKAQGYEFSFEDVRNKLGELYGQPLGLLRVPSSRVSPWARVLDTGDANTVRILLKLV